MPALSAHLVNKQYANGVQALTDLSLVVEPGEIFGFLGPNGSGKSTTVRLFNGTLAPTSGRLEVLGRPARQAENRLVCSTLTETAQMYDSLSLEDNLRFFARMYGLSDAQARQRIEELLTTVDLVDEAPLSLGSFSTGMKKRAQLARTLLNHPQIVFLDEPTSGLDPQNAREVTRLIRQLSREHGTTVFLCTHNLPLADEICDRFGFLQNGRLVRSGTREELRQAAGKPHQVLIRTPEGEVRFPLAEKEPLNAILAEVLRQNQPILEALREQPTLEEIYFAILQAGGPP